MPQPSSKERAREMIVNFRYKDQRSASGVRALHVNACGRLIAEVTAAIDAAVEAEREACARLLSALFASSKFRDPREVQTAVTEGQKLIRARLRPAPDADGFMMRDDGSGDEMPEYPPPTAAEPKPAGRHDWQPTSPGCFTCTACGGTAVGNLESFGGACSGKPAGCVKGEPQDGCPGYYCHTHKRPIVDCYGTQDGGD